MEIIKIPKITKGEVRYEIFRDRKGEFRFRVIAANGYIIAGSEGYKDKRSAVKTARLLATAASNGFDISMSQDLSRGYGVELWDGF